MYILSRGRAVVPWVRGSGVAEATEVDGENAVMLAQQRDQLAEDPPGLGEPVDQHHRGAPGAGCDVVQLGAVDADTLMVDTCDGGDSRDDLHLLLLDRFDNPVVKRVSDRQLHCRYGPYLATIRRMAPSQGAEL